MPGCPAASPDTGTADRPCAGPGRAMLAAGMAVFKGACRTFPGHIAGRMSMSGRERRCEPAERRDAPLPRRVVKTALRIDLNETLTVIRQLVTLDSYSADIQRRWRKQFPRADGSGVRSVSHEFGVHPVEITTQEVVLVVAVTREVTARAQLARQLPGDSVLLMVPDYPTAVTAFGSGVLTSHLDPAEADTVTRLGGLEIDRLGQQVAWNGNLLPLTRLERGIIGCLAEPPTQVWVHERLYREVWQEAWLGDTAALHTTVKRLRRKLREAGAPALIDSVRGVGFRLRVETPAVAEPAVRAVTPGQTAAAASPESPTGAMPQRSVRMRPSAVPAHLEPRLSA